MGGFGFVLIKKTTKTFSGNREYLFLNSFCTFYDVPAGHFMGRLYVLHCSCLQAVFPRAAGQLYGFYSVVSIVVVGH